MKKILLSIASGIILGGIAIVLFVVFIFYGIFFLDEWHIKKQGNVKSGDPCYKKYYIEKGPIYEIREKRVCMEFRRGGRNAYTKTLEGVDPKTFHELQDNYFVDENSVFYKSQKLIGVAPKDFALLDSCYAKGNGKVFYCGQEIVADYDTFEVVSNTASDYAKDKNAVYHVSTRINVKDPSTFHFLGNHYFVDQYNVYHDSLEFKILEGADPKTFSIFKGTEYAKDAQRAYYFGKEILGVDAETFEILAMMFAADQYHVYSSENVLQDLDVRNFEQVESSAYLRDADSLYYRDEKVENINAQNFHLVGYRKRQSKGSMFVSDSTSCGTDGVTVVCNGDPISGGEIIELNKSMGTMNEFQLKIPQ